MGRGAKALYALIILAYSTLCAYFTYNVGVLEYQQLKELDNVMQQIGAIGK